MAASPAFQPGERAAEEVAPCEVLFTFRSFLNLGFHSPLELLLSGKECSQIK